MLSMMILTFSDNRAEPVTPVANKSRVRGTGVPLLDTSATKSKSSASKVALSHPSADQDMPLSSDEDLPYHDEDAEEISDPNFFDEAEVSGERDEPIGGTSEAYWDEVDDDGHAATPVHTSRSVKGKARLRAEDTDDGLSDYTRRVARSSTKGKKAAVLAHVAPSTSDHADSDNDEAAQVAEAKRLSLLDSSPAHVAARKGSSSTRTQAARSATPDVFSASSPVQDKALLNSKVLKAMGAFGRKTSTAAPTTLDASTVYLEDLEVGTRGEIPPAVCEVTDVNDYDTGLGYVGFCNLRSGIFKSWSDAEHPGLATFSGYKEQCPNILLSQLKRTLEFSGHQHIRNPSRTVPSDLASKAVRGGNSLLILAGSRDTVEILSEKRRTLEGIPCVVEWERMQSVFCMAYRVPSAYVPMKGGAITFCTAKTMRTTPGSSPAKNPSGFLRKVPSTVVTSSNSGSPFKAPKAAVTGTGFIPVLDGIGHKFNMESDLLALDHKLPAYEGEIPEGSCVWVGYTSAMYEHKDRGPSINFNLMWAVVLGTP
ncbi:hypothetical protein HWV62_19155 [Athelia sp. TMB]|nr:hypothetical protein HWV62_19155 [Athelia sp. TMB]